MVKVNLGKRFENFQYCIVSYVTTYNFIKLILKITTLVCRLFYKIKDSLRMYIWYHFSGIFGSLFVVSNKIRKILKDFYSNYNALNI